VNLLHNNIGKVVHTLVTLSPSSIGIVVETRKVAAIMKEVWSAVSSRPWNGVWVLHLPRTALGARCCQNLNKA